MTEECICVEKIGHRPARQCVTTTPVYVPEIELCALDVGIHSLSGAGIPDGSDEPAPHHGGGILEHGPKQGVIALFDPAQRRPEQ